ncbi:uncharacterized protein FA14DRAFT_152532 [Meira miltonrushii]|uniref:Uncharacterized protein n=1 Tax=Meira miltonrushii TaxID=1280837 RepID=A0A316VHQ4_9BASI|nr:uncharacterized protein FA14DRAFT_152532 [Meira miltonrushii]PWN37122.1 hypothetical protein FA14DRAFT_152532 [Meira miltonrushii]
MKLASSFVLLSVVLNALLLVASASPQYDPERHEYIVPVSQDVEEIIEVPYEQDFIVGEDLVCDLDDDDDDETCEEMCIEAYEVDPMDSEESNEDTEEPILKKRETINYHQNRIDHQIILPRSLSEEQNKVTNNGPIFVKRMGMASSVHLPPKHLLHGKRSMKDGSAERPVLVKRMSIARPNIRVPIGKGNMKRRGTENGNVTGSSPNFVKRKHIDYEKTFKNNHPDGIVAKREIGSDKMQIKMVKRMAIGNEMRTVSNERWNMPHRREAVGESESPNLFKRMAVGHENRVTHNGIPI